MNDFLIRNKKLVRIFYAIVLVCMTWATVRASGDSSVIEGFRRLMADPWGLATLGDAYFAFLFFYLYLLSQESRIFPRLIWLVALMIFGNFAIALYVLLFLRNKQSLRTT